MRWRQSEPRIQSSAPAFDAERRRPSRCPGCSGPVPHPPTWLQRNTMTPASKLLTALLAALTLTAGSAMAADPVPVAGRQLMTEQEQAQMRTRMRNATTEEERARIRAEEHALIRERAAAQGITLPETPPAQGQGLGLGQGPGASAFPRYPDPQQVLRRLGHVSESPATRRCARGRRKPPNRCQTPLPRAGAPAGGSQKAEQRRRGQRPPSLRCSVPRGGQNGRRCPSGTQPPAVQQPAKPPWRVTGPQPPAAPLLCRCAPS